MTFLLSPRQAGYDLRRGTQLFTDVLARLHELPGVTAAGGATPGPMTGSVRSGNFTLQGYTPPPDTDVGATIHGVTPGFFAALRIPLLAGRDIQEADRQGAPKVAIVNQAFVRKYCEGGSAIGRQLAWGSGDVTPDIAIVGVVGDTHNANLREPAKPAVYMPYAQEQTLGRMTFYARAAVDEKIIAARLRDVVRSLDPDLPVYQLQPMQARIDEITNADRTLAILCTAFGILAVLLTAIGIYGVIAWTVSRRTNELAVRMALGALPERVLRLVMREAVILATSGVVVGTGLALAASRVVESKLFGVAGRDPLVLAVAVVCTGGMALLAAFIPAWRATRIDPARALRFE
jgi:predicted permease